MKYATDAMKESRIPDYLASVMAQLLFIHLTIYCLIFLIGDFVFILFLKAYFYIHSMTAKCTSI